MEEIKELFQTIDTELKADPARAKGVKGVYEFRFNDDPSVFQLVLKGDSGYAAEGEFEKPDCTLTLATEDFEQMANGELNGTKAFMSGKLKIKGNMGLALKLQDLLASYNQSAK